MSSSSFNPIYFDGTRYFNLSDIWCIEYDRDKNCLLVNGVNIGIYHFDNYKNLMKKWCEHLGYEYVYGQQPILWTEEHRKRMKGEIQ